MARKLTKKTTQVKKVVKKAAVVAKNTTHQVSHAVQTPTWVAPAVKFVEGVGRRKVATARVRVYSQAGDYVVNGKAAGQYFATVPHSQAIYNLPLELTELKGKVTVSALVSGSGSRAQLDAVVHGLTRALVKLNVDYKPLLKQHGLLTRDDRMKETRKIGMGGKARRQRQSPKR